DWKNLPYYKNRQLPLETIDNAEKWLEPDNVLQRFQHFLMGRLRNSMRRKGGTVSFSPWQRLPVIVRAVIGGIVILYIREVPWTGIAGHAFLAGLNLRLLPSLPWSILPMSWYLWLYWNYLNGWGWPRTNAQARRLNLRAYGLSAETWVTALFGGMIGLA